MPMMLAMVFMRKTVVGMAVGRITLKMMRMKVMKKRGRAT